MDFSLSQTNVTINYTSTTIPQNNLDEFQPIYDKHPELAICKEILFNSSMCLEEFARIYGYRTFKQCMQYVTVANKYTNYDAYTAINTTKLVIYGILLNLVCITGIVGNILSLIVLKCSEFKRSTTTVYLQGLLCIDCLYLLANLIFYGFIHGLEVGKWFISSFPAYSQAYLEYCIIDMLRNSSVLLTMAVTTDRYIYVCHSFRAADLCTEKKSRIVMGCLLLVVIIYEIPRFFIHEVIPQAVPGCDPNFYLMASGPLTIYPHVMEVLNISGLFLFLVIPLIVIIVLTSLLLRAVKQSISFRQSMHQNYNQANRPETLAARPHRPDDRSTTIILLSVIISFIICSLPNTVITLIREVGGDYWGDQYLKLGPYTCYILSKLLLNVNSASNFLLFCFFGRKFRGVFKEIFLHCRWSHRSRRAFAIMNQTMQTQVSSLNLSGRGLGSRSSTLSKSDYGKLEARYGATGGRKPTPFMKQENIISTSFDGDGTPIFQSAESIDQNGRNELFQTLLKSQTSDVSDTAC